MGNSLGAQLLQAGLVNQKQLNQAKQEQYKKKKKQKTKEQTVSESKQLAQKAMAAQKEQARQLNRERKQLDEQNAIAAQIGQMIGATRLKIASGELAYNFVDGNKIKKIYVTKLIRDQLSVGQLAIVKHKEQYEIVPTETARKIAARDRAALLVLNEPRPTALEDDPYAEFPIPDDLDW